MLNEYNNNQKVEIKPTCMGLLQKSHPKSFFQWFHVRSDYRMNKINGNPRVLQVMVFGDDNMMVEILPQEVYEEWIEKRQGGLTMADNRMYFMRNLIIFQIVLDILAFIFFLFVAMLSGDKTQAMVLPLRGSASPQWHILIY